jgi:hypothetical protein
VSRIWGNLRQVASFPHKLLLLGGSFVQQLLVAMTLSVSLRTLQVHCRARLAAWVAEQRLHR